MLNITKFPVILFCNFRTGSSALCSAIAEKYNLEKYSEPHYDIELMKQLETTSNNYIVKFMPDHVSQHSVYNQLLQSNAFKIKLYRENKVDQIVSFFVALSRNKWHMEDKEVPTDYVLDIDPDKLDASIEVIQRNDNLLDNSGIDFDLVCSYESLGIIAGDEVQTYQPANLADIKQLVSIKLGRS